MRHLIPWRIFFMLLSVSIISVFAVFPYVVTLQGSLLRQVHQPLIVIFLLQLLQSIILFSIAIFIGLYLTKKVNFSLPLLESVMNRPNAKKVLVDIAPISIVLGIIAAVSIYVVDFVFTFQGAAISTSHNPAPIWQRLLAAFYGGTTEEILMRLFVMTLFVWLGLKITGNQYRNTIISIAILLSAILFGLGHLPITSSLTTITQVIVVRAVVLNGIGGIIFGLLYWKKGLEAAMISHLTADIFLLVLLPSLFGK